MAGVTNTFGLPFPDEDDLLDGDGQIKALAEATDEVLKDLITDTGVKSDLAVTPGTNWSVVTVQYRAILSKLIEVFLQVSYSGSDITAKSEADASPGNFSPDVTDVATIADAAMRPVMGVVGLFRSSVTSGSFDLTTGGVFQLNDAHTSSKIADGNFVKFHAVYTIP